MAERLTFTLAGRDELSRVMNGTADNADRLRLRLAGITADADGRLRDLQGRFLTLAEAQRLVDDHSQTVRRSMSDLSDASDKLGESLKANLISLIPAAIPAAAGLASSAAALAGQLGAVGVAAGAYALALGPQVAAIGEALDAQDKYEEAVRTSGATSEEAIKAQVAYQQQLEKLPPATREAAVAVGILRDDFKEWSDELSGDVMAPFIKGVAVTNALLPKTSGLVRGTSDQFDRLVTLVGGAISTPGFDAMTGRFEEFATGTLRDGIDNLTIFLSKLESGQYDNSELRAWWDYAQQAGPLVGDTLENVAEALLNVLEAGSGVGVGMLEVINAVSGIVSAVPPEAIAVLLQLAIAVKAVKLAAAGGAAISAGMAALGVQIGAMRAAAAGAPGPLLATTAAIGALSKGAKLALAGTGIGLLVIALSELSQAGEPASLDVDKLTTSLGELGRTGKATGYVAQQFGADFGKLREQIQKVVDPSVTDSIDNWGSDITGGFLKASDSMEEFTESADSLDEGLASLVSSGKAEQAALALEAMTKGMNPEQLETFTGKLDNYKEALAAQAFEQKLAAEAAGLFGAQAQEVQGKLEAQRASADGLRQSLQALNDVQRQGLGGMIGFEAAIDAATKAAQENAGVLDMQGGQLVLNTEKQRAAATSLQDLAAKTDEAAASARESGASWETVNGIYDRGRQKLIESAVQMGLTRGEAKALADQILRTPDKTAKLRGDMEDLQRKLDDAKAKLKRVPDSRKAKVRADIEQLERQLAAARRQLDGIDGKTATTYVVTHYLVQGATGEARNKDRLRPGHYAAGGFPEAGELAIVGEQGPELVVFGEAARVFDATTTRQMIGDVSDGRLPIGQTIRPGMAAAPVAAPAGAGGGRSVTYNVYARQSVISASDLDLITRQEEARMRVGRPG